jgi:hypothetical protein
MWSKDVGAPDSAASSEDYDRPCTNAHLEAQALIDYFNSTLRPGEEPRELVRVEVGAGDGVRKHQWEKTNLVTVTTKDGTHDTYRCIACGATGKRYFLDAGVAIDKRYAKRVACPATDEVEAMRYRILRKVKAARHRIIRKVKR